MGRSSKRIDKLLQTEYKGLIVNESLLLESAFAETTRDGRGLREVELGLTSSKLIVASDNVGDSKIFCCAKSVDPSIESLELKSVYPLEYVKLSVFRRKKRKALEARLIDGRAKYYELGGLGCRARNWNEWCMQVHRLLNISETTANHTRQQSCNGWTRKHLYLGPDYEELFDKHYKPKPVVFANNATYETVKNDLIPARSTKPKNHKKVTRRVARFAEGVDEKCSHSLYIQVAQSSSSSSSPSSCENLTIQNNISPNSHFLRGFGPWSINPGDRISLQSRLSQSLACIRRQSPELRLPLSKRQLTRTTASLASLKLQVSTRSVVLFWTTDYWYRPRAAIEVYRDVRKHLDGFRDKSCYHRSTTIHLRQLLKLHHRLTLSDISSTTLSRQLTLIDRELFIRITINEIRNLARYRESRDAPNFLAWIALAHRVTCLLQSEVLRICKVKERSRILLRLIRTAEKCIDAGNFQSASSIVAALQSPAVYRLKATWAYLRQHHGTKYKAMAKLSKLFANIKTKHYHDVWMKNCRSSIPSIADVVMRILGLKSVRKKVDGDLKILGMRIGCWTFDDTQENKINQIVDWLENCQSRAFNYNYPSDSLAWEFLLKAKYREDRENFLLSIYLEPS